MMMDFSSSSASDNVINQEQLQSIEAWVDLLTHLLVFFILSFYLFLAHESATRANVRILLAGVLVSHGIIGYYAYRDDGVLLSLVDEEKKREWLEMYIQRTVVDLTCPLMAVICALMEGCGEERIKSPPPPGYEELGSVV